MNRKLINTIVGFLISSILFFIGLYLLKFNYGFSDDHSYWSSFGNYSSGTIGVCLSLLTVFFMYLTFKEQREERFKNNFQQYITNYYTLISLIKENWVHNPTPEYLFGREIFGRSFTKIDIDNPKSTFKHIYCLHGNVFQHFCNYLVELFEMVYSNKELDIDEQKKYIERFFSLLSTYELIFFAYYVKYLLDNKNSKQINEFLKFELAKSYIDNATPHRDKIEFIINEFNK